MVFLQRHCQRANQDGAGLQTRTLTNSAKAPLLWGTETAMEMLKSVWIRGTIKPTRMNKLVVKDDVRSPSITGKDIESITIDERALTFLSSPRISTSYRKGSYCTAWCIRNCSILYAILDLFYSKRNEICQTSWRIIQFLAHNPVGTLGKWSQGRGAEFINVLNSSQKYFFGQC